MLIRKVSPPKDLQQGVVLLLGLVTLVATTVLVLGMLRIGVVELKIGGYLHNAEQNFANAEAALAKFINDNNGRFTKSCLNAAPPNNCFCVSGDANNCTNTNNTYATRFLSGPPSKIRIGSRAFFGASMVDIQAREVGCADWAWLGTQSQMGGNGLQAIYLDIQATAISDIAGSATLHQGVSAPIPAGSCQ